MLGHRGLLWVRRAAEMHDELERVAAVQFTHGADDKFLRVVIQVAIKKGRRVH